MSNTPDDDRAPSSPSREGDRAAPARRRFWPYVAVAFVSVLVGAVGAGLALRRLEPSPASAPTPTAGQHQGHSGQTPLASGGAAHPAEASGKTVYISPARQQLIGVRTSTVAPRALDSSIRTVGMLAYDETRLTQIHAKIAGWVERVFVDYVGKSVRRGQPLFTVYSPELVSTQNEYLLALDAYRQLGDSQIAETRTSAASLLTATRTRLKLWDISDRQVADLERTREARKTLTLYSPFDGVVLERNAFAGQYITPELSTFKIADLSRIWVLGQVFEYESRLVQVGQTAEIEFPYGQSRRRLTGKITFIYPEIDPQTRRVKVRIEFRNPGLEFKPETYVTVVIRSASRTQLALPKEALIDTGARQYAILAHPNGFFEPREVKVGPPLDDYVPLLEGLQDGDRVVTSAQFLIDSETNLQSAMQAMSMSMPGMDMGGGADGKDMPDMPGMPAPGEPASGGTKPVPPAGSQAPPDHSKHR